MEGLSVADGNLVVYVHPSQTKNFSQAILRELSSLLFQYSETFEGVILSYAVNAPDKHARILSGVHPYVGVKLKAKLLLFSPKPDMLLEGKVVKVSRESINVIVLGFSSAVITDDNIRDEFSYRTKHGERVYLSRSHKKHVIKVGTLIRFAVKSFNEEILHISGSLVAKHTGSISWMNKYMEDVAVESNTKKRKETAVEPEVQERATPGREISYSNNGDKVKKSKKRRIAEEH